MAIITDLKLRKMKAGDKMMAHGGVTGLIIIPNKRKNGHGKWALRFVSPISGKRRNIGLGSYPDVSIASAAKQALEYRSQIDGGLDPLDEKRKEGLQASVIRAMSTFSEAAVICHNELKAGWKNEKHAKQWITTLETYIFPFIGNFKLNELTPALIASALKPIWLDKPETASRTKQRIHSIMAWGWANDYCQSNPVDVVHKLLPQQPSKTVR